MTSYLRLAYQKEGSIIVPSFSLLFNLKIGISTPDAPFSCFRNRIDLRKSLRDAVDHTKSRESGV